MVDRFGVTASGLGATTCAAAQNATNVLRSGCAYDAHACVGAAFYGLRGSFASAAFFREVLPSFACFAPGFIHVSHGIHEMSRLMGDFWVLLLLVIHTGNGSVASRVGSLPDCLGPMGGEAAHEHCAASDEPSDNDETQPGGELKEQAIEA